MWHDGHIAENLLYVKLGGDHGQGSLKFEFQLANVVKPNSSKRAVVFAKEQTEGHYYKLQGSAKRFVADNMAVRDSSTSK